MKALFTIPDPTLTQESSVDPLGLQVIWVSLGQAIFGDRLTTIANNPRIFTFNLMHKRSSTYPSNMLLCRTNSSFAAR
jgi:hypothetical protein